MSFLGAPPTQALVVSLLALAVLTSADARAQTALPPPPAAPPSASDVAPRRAEPAAGAPDDVEVSFSPSEPNMVIEKAPERRAGNKVDSEGWTAVCLPGCTTRLDRRGKYQVAGTWVNPAYFQLPPGPGPYRVSATEGSARGDLLGTGWLLAGAATFGLGAIATIGVFASGATKNQGPGSVGGEVLVASVTTTAVGLALIVLSIPFRTGNATHVRVDRAPPPEAPPPAAPPALPPPPAPPPGVAAPEDTSKF